MITRERLERSEYGRGLLDLFGRLTLHKVKAWTVGGSSKDDAGNPTDREEVAELADANVVSSIRKDWGEPDNYHALVLDIDHPCWLIPSTTPGHYHLYIDVPGGIPTQAYFVLLQLLARAGVIEEGYANASRARGFSSVRLPWVEKEKDNA